MVRVPDISIAFSSISHKMKVSMSISILFLVKQIDDIFDQFWMFINEDVSAQFREILQNMRNICYDLFAILKKQDDDISHLKREMKAIQMSQLKSL
ncbi:unnamed protein product [Adineta steineri]|uniref:Uncharacterized protein n=1 Tax=Adineta steineri TaxID=433720 RepID=A0A815BJC6_9BILA|nr:unnamed protein product [Adineta steineri]CAF4102746.1 unnamed protein product [Adineta steineri]